MCMHKNGSPAYKKTPKKASQQRQRSLMTPKNTIYKIYGPKTSQTLAAGAEEKDKEQEDMAYTWVVPHPLLPLLSGCIYIIPNYWVIIRLIMYSLRPLYVSPTCRRVHLLLPSMPSGRILLFKSGWIVIS